MSISPCVSKSAKRIEIVCRSYSFGSVNSCIVANVHRNLFFFVFFFFVPPASALMI